VLLPPWKFSATPARIKKRGPKMGEHNRHVFGKLLGMPQEEIARLEKKKIAY
jgi:benzylsuccinate CoA-transferase BbsF subunit